MQTVMIEAWRKRDRYDPSRPLQAWLLTILRRRAIDLVRTQKPVILNLDTAGELCGPTVVKRPNGSPSPWRCAER